MFNEKRRSWNKPRLSEEGRSDKGKKRRKNAPSGAPLSRPRSECSAVVATKRNGRQAVQQRNRRQAHQSAFVALVWSSPSSLRSIWVASPAGAEAFRVVVVAVGKGGASRSELRQRQRRGHRAAAAKQAPLQHRTGSPPPPTLTLRESQVVIRCTTERNSVTHRYSSSGEQAT